MDQELNIDLALIISELSQNAIDAGCKNLEVDVQLTSLKYYMRYEISVIDDGNITGDINKFCDKGVSYKNSSGLGLYNLKEFCDRHNGFLIINRSNKTIVKLSYEINYYDELKCLEEIIYLLSINEMNLLFKFTCNDYNFIYDTSEIKNILKEVSIKELKIMNYLKKYIHDGLNQK